MPAAQKVYEGIPQREKNVHLTQKASGVFRLQYRQENNDGDVVQFMITQGQAESDKDFVIRGNNMSVLIRREFARTSWRVELHNQGA